MKNQKSSPILTLLLFAALILTPASEALGANSPYYNYDSISVDSSTDSLVDSNTITGDTDSPGTSVPDTSSTTDNPSGDSSTTDSVPATDPSVADDPSATDSSNATDPSTVDSSNATDPSTVDSSNADGPDTSTPTISPTLTSTISPSPSPALLPESGAEETVGATYASDELVDGGTYIINCVGNTNYCLDIDGHSLSDDANIHTYKINGNYSQYFTARKLADGTFIFHNYNSDKVISASGTAAANRANVSQRTLSDSAPQRWKVQRNADGSCHILCADNEKLALQIITGYIKNRQNVRLFTRINSKSEKFVFKRVATEDYSGEIMLRSRYLGYMVVGSGESSADGTNLKLEIGVADFPYQIFRLTHVWGGFYKIEQDASNKVVDVAGAAAFNGSNVQLYTWNGSNAQLWQVRTNSDGTYTFRSRCDVNYVLDLAGRGRSVGTNLQIYTANGSTSQRFFHDKLGATYPENVKLTISSLINTDRVFTAASSKFMSYDYSDTAMKKFVLEPVNISGSSHFWYKIVTTNNKVLGVSTFNTNSSAGSLKETAKRISNSLAVSEQAWTGSFAQMWHPQLMTDGTYIIRSGLDPSYVIDLKGESEDYRAYIQTYRDVGSVAQRWHLSSYTIKSCKISASDHNTVTLKATGSRVRSDDKKAYLFAVEPYEHSLAGKSPIASASMTTQVTFTAGLNKNSPALLLQKKFYVAVKYCNIYRIVSNAYYITNPEAAATDLTAFPTPARGTKKGLKLGISDQDLAAAKNLRVSYACIDLVLDNFLSGSDYAYTYEGKTYYFSSEISRYKRQIRKYNDAGIVVTANIYLLSKRYPEFLQPEARNGSRLWESSAVAFNTRDEGRKRVEALFACIAEAFTTDGCRIANWGFGNEVNEYICFYYTGPVSYNLFHESLAEGYRMFNACIKSRWANARCYLSLDHNWNVSWPVKDSYMGMELVRYFNMDLQRQGRVHWDIAMHPYPAPEQDPRVWNRSWTVTDTDDTQQITMMNLAHWATYMKMTYGSDLHIILNETGLSSTYNGTEMLSEQAAGLALTYYLAEFNPNIDTMDYHRNIDDPGETAEGWHLGLYYKPGSGWDYSRPKPSANVFRYMDSAAWASATNRYVSLTGRGSWAAWVPGFDGSRFAGRE